MNEKIKHKIIKYLNKEYSGLIPYETDMWGNHIFFMKDGKVIFEYNKKNGYVYVSYDKIWSFLESFFGLEYEEIQDLTKEWVEEQFKMGVTTTVSITNNWMASVEEQFKMGVTTTRRTQIKLNQSVEEQFKMGVTTTQYSWLYS